MVDVPGAATAAMKTILPDLGAQHAELAALLGPLTEAEWSHATPCEGWNVADVVLHLHQSDELAIAALAGDLDS